MENSFDYLNNYSSQFNSSSSNTSFNNSARSYFNNNYSSSSQFGNNFLNFQNFQLSSLFNPFVQNRFTSLFWSLLIDDTIVVFSSYVIERFLRKREFLSDLEHYEKLATKQRQDVFTFLEQTSEIGRRDNTSSHDFIREKGEEELDSDFENYQWKDSSRKKKQMLDEIIETSLQMRRLELENLSMFGRKSFRVVHLIVSCLYYLFFRRFRSESIGNVFMMLESVDLNGGRNPISSPGWISLIIKEGLRSIIVYYLYDLFDSSLDYVFTLAKANSRSERERALESYPNIDPDYLKNSFYVKNFVSVEKIEKAKEFQNFLKELRINLANILTCLALSVQTETKSKKKKKINQSLGLLIEKSKKSFKELMSVQDEVSSWMFKYNSFALLKIETTEQVKTLIDEMEHLAVSISILNRELLELFKPALEDLGNAVKEAVGKPTTLKVEKKRKKSTNTTIEQEETRKTKKNNLEKLIDEYEQKLKDLESHCTSLKNMISSPPKTDTLLSPFYRKENVLSDKLRVFLMNLPIRTVLVYLVELLLSYYMGVRADLIPTTTAVTNQQQNMTINPNIPNYNSNMTRYRNR